MHTSDETTLSCLETKFVLKRMQPHRTLQFLETPVTPENYFAGRFK